MAQSDNKNSPTATIRRSIAAIVSGGRPVQRESPFNRKIRVERILH